MTQTNTIYVYPVPLDLSTTFGHGTHNAPHDIASVFHQLDACHPFKQHPFEVQFLSPHPDVLAFQQAFNQPSRQIIEQLNHALPLSDEQVMIRQRINEGYKTVHATIYDDCLSHINGQRPLILCGGEHGVGIGYVQALAHKGDAFSVLQIDAHMDCRVAYFGYDYSHASVMTHYAAMPPVTSITQVGIRDYDACEVAFQSQQSTPFYTFYDYSLHRELMLGTPWIDGVKKIIDTCSDRVFISLDVDGLMPSLCWNTGTPVPGGLGFNQLAFLFEQLSTSRTIIGAELVEVNNGVGGGVWPANVGARLIQLMAGLFVE